MLMEALQAQQFDRIVENRVNRGERFTLLGDGIFRFAAAGSDVLTSYHIAPANGQLEQWQQNENKLYKSIRQHIEHSYGQIESLFALCAAKRNFKLRALQPIAAEVLNLSFFFMNCYVCDNGNSSSNRFGLIPPTLDEYLNNNE